ncbi:MAG: bifunctional 4-hydroxy-2-oxoglutarate aldolase/2-dehydro-3-deoxy-phosphogluconate aldolase, partial [Thermomicrobiales bacterium]
MTESGPWLFESGVVAIVRLDNYASANDIVSALITGGVDAVEFTYTNPAAGAAIASVRAAFPTQIAVGAGTVLDPETARAAILLGAQFIVTPTFNRATVELCTRYAVASVIGAFTPTEILNAWQAGATYVKVFPASSVGPRYLKDVLGPLPQIRLIPTGGVTVENAGDFIRAGASGIAAGSNLVDSATVAAGDWSTIT